MLLNIPVIIPEILTNLIYLVCHKQYVLMKLAIVGKKDIGPAHV